MCNDHDISQLDLGAKQKLRERVAALRLHHFFSGLAIAGVALLAAACGSGAGTDAQVAVFDVEDNLNRGDFGSVADIFEIEKLVAPEFTDSTIMKYPEIKGVSKAGNIYIFDSETENLMIFNRDGRAISSFNKIGQGPGECAVVRDAWPTPGQEGWTVYDDRCHKVLGYDVHGTCIREVDNVVASHIWPYREGWLALNESVMQPDVRDPKILYTYDESWRLTDSIPTGFSFFMTKDYVMKDDVVYVRGPKAYMEEADSLFEIDVHGRRLIPAMAVDLGDKRMPRFDTYEEAARNRDNYISCTVIPGAGMAWITYRYKDNLINQLYDGSTGQLLYSQEVPYGEKFGLLAEIDGHQVGLVPNFVATPECFYGMVLQEEMAEITGTDDCNPTIYTLRRKR